MIKHANPFGLRVPIKMSYRNIKNWMGINNSNSAELMTALLWSVCFMCNNTGEVCKGVWATNYCLLLEGRCADLYRCLSTVLCLISCLLKTFTIKQLAEALLNIWQKTKRLGAQEETCDFLKLPLWRNNSWGSFIWFVKEYYKTV